jgi:hypothetical protein
VPEERPPGKCRTAYSNALVSLRALPAAAPDEAEQGEDEDDDQDDPQEAHISPWWLS